MSTAAGSSSFDRDFLFFSRDAIEAQPRIPRQEDIRETNEHLVLKTFTSGFFRLEHLKFVRNFKNRGPTCIFRPNMHSEHSKEKVAACREKPSRNPHAGEAGAECDERCRDFWHRARLLPAILLKIR